MGKIDEDSAASRNDLRIIFCLAPLYTFFQLVSLQDIEDYNINE